MAGKKTLEIALEIAAQKIGELTQTNPQDAKKAILDEAKKVCLGSVSNLPNTSRMITFNGKTQCMEDWANELGMAKSTLETRINKLNWDIKSALTTPVRRKNNARNS